MEENVKDLKMIYKMNRFDIFLEKFERKAGSLWRYFSTYEKIWFFSILVLAVLFAFLFPEEDVGGVNGAVIMALYLVDILANILCELLISKQSKWNFLVSLVVELTEIAICIVCAYRFATMAVTLFFWIPIDIISFFMWHKHRDKKEKELTVVRKLSGWQEILVIAGIVVWTVVVGYLMTLIDVEYSIVKGMPAIEKAICYIDAGVSAVGIANGLFILFRYREQWIAWYICTILETVINILSGQWVLLVLKAGYLTNTTYGFIKWTKYIKEKKAQDKLDTNQKTDTEDSNSHKAESQKQSAQDEVLEVKEQETVYMTIKKTKYTRKKKDQEKAEDIS